LRLYAASLRGGVSPASVNLRAPSGFLVGNEGAGLPAEIEHSADALLRIPIEPPVDSLNAAIAASILLYEAASQRSSSD
jgi:TrmH family RNA methyltransferase